MVIDLLLYLHAAAQLRIATAHGLTPPVHMHRGIRQGNPERPLLYLLLLGPCYGPRGYAYARLGR